MYLLIEVCQNPGFLRILYFVSILLDIIFTIVPIGLIVMLLIDFTKGLFKAEDYSSSKDVKNVIQRIITAVLLFSLPWLINAFMSIMDSVGWQSEFTTCWNNAKSGDFAVYDVAYQKELEEKAEARKKILEDNIKEAEQNRKNNRLNIISENKDISSIIEDNIYQSDDRWGSYPLCTNKQVALNGGDNRTISSSACGFCSLTMVLRTFGYTDYTPDKVVREVCDLGYGKSGHAVPDDFEAMAKKYGLKSKVYYSNINPKSSFVDTFTPQLKEGKRLIVNMPGHYISVLGIQSNGYLYVGDSSKNRDYSKKGPYTMETLYDTITASGSLLNVTAIWKE